MHRDVFFYIDIFYSGWLGRSPMTCLSMPYILARTNRGSSLSIGLLLEHWPRLVSDIKCFHAF